MTALLCCKGLADQRRHSAPVNGGHPAFFRAGAAGSAKPEDDNWLVPGLHFAPRQARHSAGAWAAAAWSPAALAGSRFTASRVNLTTLALETEYVFETWVSDMPESRSRTSD